MGRTDKLLGVEEARSQRAAEMAPPRPVADRVRTTWPRDLNAPEDEAPTWGADPEALHDG